MSPAQRLSTCVIMVAGLALVAGAATLEAGAQSAPLEVTTDTSDYCQHLSAQVVEREKALNPAPPDVVRLSDEGERLCDEGQVRGGIQRLRRAWLLITHPDQQPQSDR